MTINFKAPEIKELQPRLLVLGVGGAGGNAINEMIENNLQGVEFIAVNTDAQDLKLSKAKTRIQIGLNLTKGLGAGAKHDITKENNIDGLMLTRMKEDYPWYSVVLGAVTYGLVFYHEIEVTGIGIVVKRDN